MASRSRRAIRANAIPDVIAGLDPAIHVLRESSCEVDGCPGQAHGCPVERKWLRALRRTRISGDPTLFRLAFSAVTNIKLSYDSRSALEKIGCKHAVWSTHEVFATELDDSKALFRLRFHCPAMNRTAVGHARP